MSDAPYDPYIPAGGAAAGAGPQQGAGNARTQALQEVSCNSFLLLIDALRWMRWKSTKLEIA